MTSAEADAPPADPTPAAKPATRSRTTRQRAAQRAKADAEPAQDASSDDSAPAIDADSAAPAVTEKEGTATPARPRRTRRRAGAAAATTPAAVAADAPQADSPAELTSESPSENVPAADDITSEDVVVSDLAITELTEQETEALLAEGLALAAQTQESPVVNTFGLLFQAPEPAAAPRRRRVVSPAGPVGEVRPDGQDSEGSDQAAPIDAPDDAENHDQILTEDLDDSDGDLAGRRRRRRGGKGRRRSGLDDDRDESTAQTGDDGDEEPVERLDEVDGEDAESGVIGRRRTRRRRRSGSATEGEDPPGTVTKVREPRRDRDEATGIKGSTRLEAKKQRRREGREAGRRRTVITEAEFLARRESVERVMVVRQQGERTQIGVLEDGILVEHYVSKADSGQSGSMAGNVYLGRVQNVLPSMEAAFVDIGRGRNAVLYAGEVNWDAAGLEGHKSRRIENALKSGQGVLVQVTKDPIGHKGARLTSQVSLPGRYLVYVPQGKMTGISRKLPDVERSRLKKILKEIVPADAGVIVRTAAEGASEAELRADVDRLTKAWAGIQKKVKSGNAPALLHGEVDLTVRVIRDVFNEDFTSMVVSGDNAWNTVNDYLAGVAPELAARLQRWTGEKDVFAEYRIDEQLAKAMDRKVWLPSGGSLVIDRTEAMTVIDVNTGKFVGAGGNLEETVTKNNIEAAEEIVRQLRLRDIGGIIVIDFIDMVLESNRDLVVRRLLECLGRDRTKHQVAEVTSLGLVQMTRKRVGAGLIEVFSESCEHCNGRGIIVSSTPVDKASTTSTDATASDGGGRRGRRSRGSSAPSTGGGSTVSSGAVTASSGGSAGASSPATAASAENATATGPTPAQIAAAAYAALHPVGSAEIELAESASVQPEPVVAQQSDSQDVSRPVKTGRVRRGVSRPPTTPASAPDASGSVTERTEEGSSMSDSSAMGWPQGGTAGEAEESALGWPQGSGETPETASEPQRAPRRRRSRVVAPAGPPVPVRAEDGESSSGTPVLVIDESTDLG
nr:Rne/Rng family ribonuclease [Austwickia sp. TVS 96-490-7B]